MICKAENCYKNAVRYGFCFSHQHLHERKPLPIFSKTRQQENREYSMLRRQFLSERKYCKIQSPVCTHKATVVHHTRGRGKKYFLNVETWLESCESCNNYVEVHDGWAREHGFKKSRLIP